MDNVMHMETTARSTTATPKAIPAEHTPSPLGHFHGVPFNDLPQQLRRTMPTPTRSIRFQEQRCSTPLNRMCGLIENTTEHEPQWHTRRRQLRWVNPGPSPESHVTTNGPQSV